VIQIIKRLVCDSDVTVREIALQSLYQIGVRFCKQIYSEINNAQPVNEWERACAVQLLAFCGNIEQIEAARFDKEFLVRQVADSTLEKKLNQIQLQRHIEKFITADGLERVSAYLCLKEQGDWNSVVLLNKRLRKGGLSHIFLPSLERHINKRLTKEYKEKQEKENKLQESRGTISFD
jgi:hypothetical protein